MKAVAEIVAAIILLASGGHIAPKFIKEVRTESIKKVNQGLPSLEEFSKKITR